MFEITLIIINIFKCCYDKYIHVNYKSLLHSWVILLILGTQISLCELAINKKSEFIWHAMFHCKFCREIIICEVVETSNKVWKFLQQTSHFSQDILPVTVTIWNTTEYPIVKRMISIAKKDAGKLITHINLGRARVLSFCTQSKPTMDSSAHRRWEIPQYIWDGTQDYLLPLPLHVCPPAHEVVVSLGSVWVLCSAQAAQSSGETSFSHSAHFHPPSHITSTVPPALPWCHLAVLQVNPTHCISKSRSFPETGSSHHLWDWQFHPHRPGVILHPYLSFLSSRGLISLTHLCPSSPSLLPLPELKLSSLPAPIIVVAV